MSQQGAAMQTYNNELVKCLEELCSKREELNQQIQKEEEEKVQLQHEIRLLTEKLSRVNESLARRTATRAEFDRTIAETEAAYMKVRRPSAHTDNMLCSLHHHTLHHDPAVQHYTGEFSDPADCAKEGSRKPQQSHRPIKSLTRTDSQTGFLRDPRFLNTLTPCLTDPTFPQNDPAWCNCCNLYLPISSKS
ncbi:hypothetical protein JZ751_011974 [Albula glossodonta]|uniref:Sjoegren syndrome nuclear autoantigen 1 n=1 Tax=Albula glossodonta TaxID=121402 RepID=A0A8T2PR65_9TELE|nr:hypothetical protein JZ751_011974 [Albula glossodonta]